MKFYIADCHFDHEKALELDRRPFGNLEAMNQAMIQRWNDVVTKNKDEVYILGDLLFGKGERANEILSQLNGKKYLIAGNHDRGFLRDKKFDTTLVEWIKDYAEIKDNGRKIVLCHYPIICYNGQYHGDHTYMLYGHVHNTKDYENVKSFQKQSKNVIYTAKGKGNAPGQERNLACNLINCFAGFCEYTPFTLDQWIAQGNL